MNADGRRFLAATAAPPHRGGRLERTTRRAASRCIGDFLSSSIVVHPRSSSANKNASDRSRRGVGVHPDASGRTLESRRTRAPLSLLEAVRVGRFFRSLKSLQDQTLPGPLDRDLGRLRVRLFHHRAAAPTKGFVKRLRPFLAASPRR